MTARQRRLEARKRRQESLKGSHEEIQDKPRRGRPPGKKNDSGNLTESGKE